MTEERWSSGWERLPDVDPSAYPPDARPLPDSDEVRIGEDLQLLYVSVDLEVPPTGGSIERVEGGHTA